MAVSEHSPDSGHLFCISLIWTGCWCGPGMHRAKDRDAAVPLGASVAEARAFGTVGAATRPFAFP